MVSKDTAATSPGMPQGKRHCGLMRSVCSLELRISLAHPLPVLAQGLIAPLWVWNSPSPSWYCSSLLWSKGLEDPGLGVVDVSDYFGLAVCGDWRQKSGPRAADMGGSQSNRGWSSLFGVQGEQLKPTSVFAIRWSGSRGVNVKRPFDILLSRALLPVLLGITVTG